MWYRFLGSVWLCAAWVLGTVAAQPADAPPEKLTVAVSILPQAHFVERVGGERVRVIVLVGPGHGVGAVTASYASAALGRGKARRELSNGLVGDGTVEPRLLGRADVQRPELIGAAAGKTQRSDDRGAESTRGTSKLEQLADSFVRAPRRALQRSGPIENGKRPRSATSAKHAIRAHRHRAPSLEVCGEVVLDPQLRHAE